MGSRRPTNQSMGQIMVNASQNMSKNLEAPYREMFEVSHNWSNPLPSYALGSKLVKDSGKILVAPYRRPSVNIVPSESQDTVRRPRKLNL